MDAAHEVAQLPQRRLGLVVRVARPARRARVGVGVELVTGGAEIQGQAHEPLLRAVVQVALDAAPLGLRAVDGSDPTGLGPADAPLLRGTSIGTEEPPRRRRVEATEQRPSTHGATTSNTERADARDPRTRRRRHRRRTTQNLAVSSGKRSTRSGQGDQCERTAPHREHGEEREDPEREEHQEVGDLLPARAVDARVRGVATTRILHATAGPDRRAAARAAPRTDGVRAGRTRGTRRRAARSPGARGRR